MHRDFTPLIENSRFAHRFGGLLGEDHTFNARRRRAPAHKSLQEGFETFGEGLG